MKHFTVAIFLCFSSLSSFGQLKQFDDNSLDTTAYYKLGLPNINQTWTLVEYAKVFEVLDSIKRRDVTQLPRKNSPVSGVIFGKISSLQDLEETYFDTLSFDGKLKMIDESTKILTIYTYGDSLSFSGECIDMALQGMQINFKLGKSGRELIDMAKSVVDSTDKEALKTIRDAEEGVYEGLFMALDNGFDILEGSGCYPKEDIIRTSEFLIDYVSQIVTYLTENRKKDVIKHIEFIAEKHLFVEVRENAAITLKNLR